MIPGRPRRDYCTVLYSIPIHYKLESEIGDSLMMNCVVLGNNLSVLHFSFVSRRWPSWVGLYVFPFLRLFQGPGKTLFTPLRSHPKREEESDEQEKP